MLAALAASAAPLVDADGFALEGTTTMLAAGRPGSVWMLRTVPLFDDMCVSTDGHGAFGGIADRTYMPSSKRGAVRCWIASDAHPLIGQCKSICSSAVKPKTTINPLDATFDEAKAECEAHGWALPPKKYMLSSKTKCAGTGCGSDLSLIHI